METFIKCVFVIEWLLLPLNALSRCSIVVLYLRIFTKKWTRAISWVVIGYLVASCAGSVTAANLQCIPLAYTWDKSIQGGHCLDESLWYKVAGLFNIFADLVILLLPAEMIWSLNTSRSQKAVIALIFLTSSLYFLPNALRLIRFVLI